MRLLAAAAAAALAAAPLAAAAFAQPGKPAPLFTLPTTDPSGKRVLKLQTLRGKPVYLNFFASWCGPCNDEAPYIALLRERFKKTGLQVVGVDFLESGAQAAEFQKKHMSPYSIVTYDVKGQASRDYGVFGLPAHVFIGRDGNVRVVHPGEMNAQEIEAAIKQTLR